MCTVNGHLLAERMHNILTIAVDADNYRRVHHSRGDALRG
jgi:hypothetical protein